MNKVSICIPAYNQPNYLRRALESVCIQTFKDYEVVITDDSPDNSVGLVVDEFRSCINIRYYKNTTRLGSPENWNEAVSKSSGEYIKILHHDDWFADEKCLSDFVSMLDENSDIQLAFSPSINVGVDGKVISIHNPSSSSILEMYLHPEILLWGNRVGSPSATIYRRQDQERYDRKLKWVVDTEFYYRLLLKNPFVKLANRPLICIDNSTLGRVTNECQTNRSIQIYENLYFYMKINKRNLPYIYYARYLWSLFRRYQVNNHSDFFECGVDYPIPFIILSIAYLQHFTAEGMQALQKHPIFYKLSRNIYRSLRGKQANL